MFSARRSGIIIDLEKKYLYSKNKEHKEVKCYSKKFQKFIDKTDPRKTNTKKVKSEPQEETEWKQLH